MKRWQRTALVLSTLLVVSVPLLAQGPPKGGPGGGAPGQRGTGGPGRPAGERGGPGGGGQGRRGGNLVMMPIPALATLVTLKPEQKTKLTAIQTKLKKDMAALNGDREKMGTLFTTAGNDMKAVLTADQQKTLAAKLPVITLLNRSRAVPSAVLADVKLTSAQMSKITTAATAVQTKMQAIPQADRRTKGQELMTGFKTQVDGILTPAQKAIIAKYHPPMQAGFGRPSPMATPGGMGRK